MTDRIEPALTAETWASIADNEFARYDLAKRYASGTEGTTVGLIALLNAALPDSDPRKITREWVSALESAAHDIDGEWGVGDKTHPPALLLWRIAAALESYLPPE